MKLWIDDIRTPPIGYDLWAKNYNEAILLLNEHKGNISGISFDHDIASYDDFGNELTGYSIAVYIEQEVYYDDFDPLVLMNVQVHSSNSSGNRRIVACFLHMKEKFNNDMIVKLAPYESLNGVDSFGHVLTYKG